MLCVVIEFVAKDKICKYCSAPTASDGEATLRAIQEANMSTEMGSVALDILSLYCSNFKVVCVVSLFQVMWSPLLNIDIC